ncbi:MULTISPECIES: hypothetical protein [Paraburkholderia]|uniref:hypothetical protein n=1 Tax=Paraburkholderia TaxID=1822464 RepID=UPI0022502B10|nr:MULTISPECIES: hypothetical protein [Paraburkholderia]MCX4164261.1 hypothetical protein [Paraburkholderia megapolitana]MDN7159754.1 hypothetical protein [Paraburkholderia sp. CHISQ3]MDQ6496801.1 hypothetical protein [Paraburkholderia megapolitana]
MKKTILFLLLACIYVNSALAQVLKYDSEAELMGAAATSPSSTGEILVRLVGKCGTYDDSLRTSGDQVLRSWQERHHAYLDENRRVRTQLEAMYTTPEARNKFEDMMEKQVPALVDKQYQVYAAMIDATSDRSGKVQLCNSYFQAISAQKFDLKVNDPTLAAYLDKRIRGRSKTK